MIHKSISSELVTYLKKERKFIFGGILEDYGRRNLRTKASNVSRRLRELAEDEIIEKTYKNVEGKKVVMYRFKRT